MSNNINDIYSSNNLVKLVIPSGWSIIKNNLLDIDVDVLNHLDKNLLSQLIETHYKFNVFNALFCKNKLTCLYRFYIHVSCTPLVSRWQYDSFSYQLTCSVWLENKFSNKEVFKSGKEFLRLDELRKKMNELFFLSTFELNEMIDSKAIENLESVLNKDS